VTTVNCGCTEQLNMRENWTKYAAPFNPQALTLIGVCERAFQRLMTTKYNGPGPLLDEEVLRDPLADIREAIDGIIQADIEPEAKELLLEILREAENAIRMYQISGLAGLRLAAERMFGAFIVNYDLVKQPRNQGAVRRVWGGTCDSPKCCPERILHKPTHRGQGKRPCERDMGKRLLSENAESIVIGTPQRTIGRI
jgi:hypothetical protein